MASEDTEGVFANVNRGERVETLKTEAEDALPLKGNIIKTQNNKLWFLQAGIPGCIESRQSY